MDQLIPIGMDIDSGLDHKPRLRAALTHTICPPLDPNSLRLWASRRSASKLASTLRETRASHPGPWITFSGSGDFHHLSLVLLEGLPTPPRPFTLILIDNHPDWFRLPPRYHCGNWVAGALSLPFIRSVVMIGQDSSDLAWHSYYTAPLSEIASGRIQVFPYQNTGARVPLRWPKSTQSDHDADISHPWGASLHYKTIHSLGPAGVFEQVAQRLRGQDLYVSIDKDVLDPRDAATDWEQGKLRLPELLAGLRTLRTSCRVIGADICGDKAPTPLSGTLKKIDAGRRASWVAPTPTEHRLNEDSSLAILNAFMETTQAIPAARASINEAMA